MNIKMNKDLGYMVWYLAHENIGIYPQSAKGGTHPYEKRSEWMEGWNACAIKLTRYAIKIEKWLGALPESIRPLVIRLIFDQQINLSINDEISLYINCSDTFYWGCSDSEEIKLEELKKLVECYKLSPSHGGDLWVCRKRKMRPQTACYKGRYPKKEWCLFDDAGNERTDPDGVDRKTL